MDDITTEQKNKKRKVFLVDALKGYAMGIAFIIPGFSGGSIAAILGIYEKLVGAVANLFVSFKKSFITLLPIFAGLALGAVSLLFPLGFALDSFPLETVSLFVGLALGGLTSVTQRITSKPTYKNYLALALSLIFALSLSFLPVGAEKDLLSLSFLGYALLFLIGVVGSSALVVPGISGSMILLILGYYNPIIGVFTDNLLIGRNVGKSILILGVCSLGIAAGFIAISILMKNLLSRYPRGTYCSIVGFIIGSVPTVYASTAKEAGIGFESLPNSALFWIVCAALLLLGFFISFFFTKKFSGRSSGE